MANRWEYFTVMPAAVVPAGTAFEYWEISRQLDNHLERYGREGWELVALQLLPERSGVALAVFKRDTGEIVAPEGEGHEQGD